MIEHFLLNKAYLFATGILTVMLVVPNGVWWFITGYSASLVVNKAMQWKRNQTQR